MKLDRLKLDYYLGPMEGAYFSNATDPITRNEAASGGTVSALLAYMMERKMIDGALLARTIIRDGALAAESFIAADTKSIMAARGSIYMDFDHFRILPQAREFAGRLAIVALPCQITAWRNLLARDPGLAKKAVCLIGLFCGHLSRPELTGHVLKKEGIDLKTTARMRFRIGHWRGNMSFTDREGRAKLVPFGHFGCYQNLFFFCATKCLACHDHTAERADLSLGDIWDRKAKAAPIKRNALIARNKPAVALLSEAANAGVLALEKISRADIFRAQKRSLICHKHIEARRIIGRIFGYQAPHVDSPYNRARWNDLVSAFFVSLNAKASESKLIGRVIFLLPRAFWLPYLYLMKILVNF